MKIKKKDILYTFCLNGIGNFSNIFWVNELIKKIKTGKFRLIYDYNYITECDQKVLNLIGVDNFDRIDFEDENNKDYRNIFLCDTLDNFEKLDCNNKLPIEYCFFGGLGKTNYSEQISTLEKYYIKKVVTDILPDEMQKIGLRLPDHIVNNFDFWEPSLQESNQPNPEKQNIKYLFIKCSQKINLIEKLLFDFFENCDTAIILDFTKASNKYTAKDLLLSKQCKKIIFLGDNPLLHNYFALQSIDNNVEFIAFGKKSMSILRYLNLPHWYLNNLFDIDVRLSEKSLRGQIKDFLSDTNPRFSKNGNSVLSNSFETILKQDIRHFYSEIFTTESRDADTLNNISDYLFKNDNKVHTGAFLMLLDNNLREYLSHNHKIFIFSYLIYIISKKKLNNRYIYSLNLVFSIDPFLFIEALDNTLKKLGSNLNFFIHGMYILISSFDYPTIIRHSTINLLLKHTVNPTVISRMLFSLDDFDQFDEYILRNEIIDSHEILSSSIDFCLKFKSHFDLELIDNYYEQFKSSKSSSVRKTYSFLAETKLLILKGMPEDAYNSFNNHFKSPHANFSELNIFEIIFFSLTRDSVHSARQYFKHLNPNVINKHAKLGYFCLKILLFDEIDSQFCYSFINDIDSKIFKNNSLIDYLFYKIIFTLSSNINGLKTINSIIILFSNNFSSILDNLLDPLCLKFNNDPSIIEISKRINENLIVKNL